MKRSLYDVLEVHSKASPEIIAAAMAVVTERLQRSIDAGELDAKSELAIAREAFAVLSDRQKRMAYDETLDQASGPSQVRRSSFYQSTVKPDSWWDGRKTSLALLAVFTIAVIYLASGFFKTAAQRQVNSAAIQAVGSNDAIRANNEGRLVDGVVQNTATVIERNSQISNRMIGVQETAENRRTRELDYRASATNQMIDLRRVEQNERLDRQRARDAAEVNRQVHAQRETERRREQDRIDRERRYYACLNPAIDLYGASRAQTMCASQR